MLCAQLSLKGGHSLMAVAHGDVEALFKPILSSDAPFAQICPVCRRRLWHSLCASYFLGAGMVCFLFPCLSLWLHSLDFPGTHLPCGQGFYYYAGFAIVEAHLSGSHSQVEGVPQVATCEICGCVHPRAVQAHIRWQPVGLRAWRLAVRLLAPTGPLL